MSSTGIRGLAVTAAIVAVGLTGCAAKRTGPTMCTKIGCEPGLSIDVRGPRDSDITVKISAADGQLRTFECDSEAPSCSSFFADYTPENVTVTITKKESNTVRAFQVTYQNERPNGEDCPPVCKQGHIDMTI